MKPYLYSGFLAVCFFSLLCQSMLAQVTVGADTLRLMSYNLTNYGNNITGCTNANNGPTLKNPEFKTIMKHSMPDVLGVCEMNTNPIIATGFLNNVMNTDGVTYYRRSNQQAEPAGTLTSILIYNSLKLTLKQQSYASTPYRLVHHFRLFLNTESLATGDTLWLNVLAGHLKAGNTTTDAADRATMTSIVRTYLNSFSKKENCVIMGDFNTYRSTEVAWTNLTASSPNPTYQFFDPVNRVGTWTSNSGYADVHSQCPSLTSNGCYSGGGLDDRFDFILMNRHILSDSAGLKYISGTYRALGNDGQHYNKNITDNPTNTSAPLNVITSLYKASDHLPIVCKVLVNGTFVTATKPGIEKLDVNGWTDGNTLFVSDLPDENIVEFLLMNTSGLVLKTVKTGQVTEGTFQIALPAAASGLLLGKGRMANGRLFVVKIPLVR